MQKLRPDMDIGKNIQKLRLKNKLTQAEVVAKMGILGCSLSRVIYARMENCTYNIKVSELCALKIIFGADFNDFFEGLIPDDFSTF